MDATRTSTPMYGEGAHDTSRPTLRYEDRPDEERPTLPSETTLARETGRPAPLRVDTFADAFFAAGPAAAARAALDAARQGAEDDDRAGEDDDRELAHRRAAIARGVLAVVFGCAGLLAVAFAIG